MPPPNSQIMPTETIIPGTFHPQSLSPSEQVLACCAIARERLEAGEYEQGCGALQHWWALGEWPRQNGLTPEASAELLLVAGTLCGWVASSKKISGGRKPAEALLNGAIAIFEQIGETVRASEGRIELACCYYHQGHFDLARLTLRRALGELSPENHELRGIGLIRLAVVERFAGRFHEAVALIEEATTLLEESGSWLQGRLHLEFANSLKEQGIAENRRRSFERALGHYREALRHFKEIDNHRYAAIVENNYGCLLSTMTRFDEACLHLVRARSLFELLQDNVRRAQVDETLAQLYLSSGKYDLAERSINLSVDTLETSGEDAFLAESLITKAIVLCKLGRKHEAKPNFERAQRVAERCEDYEAAGRALLILIEEMCEQLADDERREIGAQANQLLANSQQQATRERLRKCLDMIAEAHTRHEAQREQKAMADKMAALGELSFGVAHNVNNTLTGILGRAQLLLRSNDPVKIQAGLELIIKSAEDGAQIIRRIQDFARQRPSREFETLAVADLLKDACEMTRSRWEVRNELPPIRFALVADCEALVKGDPVELREVLVNMIFNAIDAMPEGGEIRLFAQESRDRVVVNIGDSGMGMSPEVKSRLFDPFFTTKGRKGTGMGLAVSFGIVRRHDGTIDVESEPARGTTFKISLPKVARTVSRAATATTVDTKTNRREDKPRVLVVDDETPVREVLIEALQAEGCEVLEAESGEAALEIFDREQDWIDAVFTDIGMPEMTGWELVTAIRERSKTVPLAIVSGWADAISVDTRNAVQADWVVAKPFDIDKISGIAQEIAARRTL
ncbi:MAG: hypothetical protein C5B55_07550 [Blastocatellia bacterium]|nr:MAG: hypothetical protein C5B55_07550 [Blastocatellia bacterium]